MCKVICSHNVGQYKIEILDLHFEENPPKGMSFAAKITPGRMTLTTTTGEKIACKSERFCTPDYESASAQYNAMIRFAIKKTPNHVPA